MMVELLITASQSASIEASLQTVKLLENAVALYRYFISEIKLYPFAHEFELLKKYIYALEVKHGIKINIDPVNDQDMTIPHMSLIIGFDQAFRQARQSMQPPPRNIRFNLIGAVDIHAEILPGEYK
jgi:sensor histidine kinase YesM